LRCRSDPATSRGGTRRSPTTTVSSPNAEAAAVTSATWPLKAYVGFMASSTLAGGGQDFGPLRTVILTTPEDQSSATTLMSR